jgi:hypothetical protein
MTPKDLDKKIEEANKPVTTDEETVLSNLAGHLETLWERAKQAKIDVERRILDIKRTMKGEYSQERLAAIKQLYGESYIPVFMMLTPTKVNTAVAWLKKIMIQPNEESWDVQPTPKPELPAEVIEELKGRLKLSMLQYLAVAYEQQGIPFTPETAQQIISDVDASDTEIMELLDKEIRKRAKEAAQKMKQKIADQFAEGGWQEAFEDVIPDIVEMTGILKGPVINKKASLKTELNPITGKWDPLVVEEILPNYERRSPLNIYPGPDSCDIDDGYLFDLVSMTPKQVTELIGLEGFNEEAVRTVIQQYRAGGLKLWTGIESERALVEDKNTSLIYQGEKIDCLNFWGTAPGYMLQDWGMSTEDVPDRDLEYDICAWKIGPYIIKAMINPHPLGKKPYAKTSFIEVADSFWGRGIPHLLKDIQNIVNAIARALVNNVGIASGPLVEMDSDRVAAGTSPALWPWKVVWSTTDQMKATPAVRYYMPKLISDSLINLFEFFLKLADEWSFIPRYAHGDQSVGGAGKTASGLSMLMSSSARGIESITKNVDKLISTTVNRTHEHNLIYESHDIRLMGDMKIVSKGVASIIAKEQMAVRRGEFMDKTMNDIDMAIIGLPGRKELLKEAAKGLDMDVDRIIQDEDRLDEIMKQRLITGGGVQGGGANPPGAEVLNSAGQSKGSEQANLTQNQKGTKVG